MGVNLRDIIISRPLELKDLSGKRIAVDAYNILYQFLSAIRQRDGTPLKDSKGNITSHLSGLFYRTANILELDIKPCFVFDGQAPDLKADTQSARVLVKKKAEKKYKKALDDGDFDAARKYAQQTSYLTPQMVKESKELLDAMGLPWVQAIADGESQAAYMCQKDEVYATVSQDYDSLLFGTTKLVRNLALSGKRKIANKSAYVEVRPEIIDLTETLNNLKIDRIGLVKLALLVGTDFNKGIKGIGPKNAMKIVQEGKFSEYEDKIPHCKQVMDIFLKPHITKDYSLKWKTPDLNKIKKILCDEHEFTENRINNTLKKISKGKGATKQKGLSTFLPN